ncbi:DUF4037 domain-containing protein [Natronosporangium hydrolyticum]|uniref:DUF4037 domain-containing protein n=2 Tax=Natronosporangium hydrolyticum TaxID=2811111 RepID=A0A895YNU8_9ACTN|nr:DUF4037 domain-containing protein [Natronosporangium hydrolyticum]
MGTPHAAALLGEGSEVLGYDDKVSTDHDFGPRVQIFLPRGVDPAPAEQALTGLPQLFEGFLVGYSRTHHRDGRADRQVDLTTVEEFFTTAIGTDPASGMQLADWLLTPTQRLASLTAGPVFHDPHHALTTRRDALTWYPDDVWRYVLAAGWLRIGQEESFVGRAGATGDDLGSRVLTARLVRDLMRLTYLIERRWAPYGKWLGRGFTALPLGAAIGPALDAALTVTDWRDREEALCAAASELAAATNRLQLADPVDPSPRQFYGRDIWTPGGERYAAALTAAITDPAVTALLARLGERRDPGPGMALVGRLPGAIDQAVDSADILCHHDRCRAAAPVLGLA